LGYHSLTISCWYKFDRGVLILLFIDSSIEYTYFVVGAVGVQSEQRFCYRLFAHRQSFGNLQAAGYDPFHLCDMRYRAGHVAMFVTLEEAVFSTVCHHRLELTVTSFAEFILDVRSQWRSRVSVAPGASNDNVRP
jgi:hypothetical protein